MLILSRHVAHHDRFRMNFIRVILEDVRKGKNLDVYLTISISACIAALGIFSVVNQEVVASATLATLAIVAVSLLKNRNEEENIKNVLEKLQDDYISASSFFRVYTIPQSKNLLPTAQSAFFWGVNFRRTITVWDSEIERSLVNGAKLRFLLSKPNSSALEMAAFTRRPRSTRDRENKTLQNSITRLAEISNSIGKIDSIEVRVIDHLPPWVIITIDPNSGKGTMSIVLFSFRNSTEERPTLKLLAEKDKHWFDFFVDQFEQVWGDAESIDLKQYLTQSL